MSAGADLTTRLEPRATSARAARTFVRGALNGPGSDAFGDVRDDVRYVVELLVGELVTNAVLHARTGLHLRLHIADGRVRVEVGDGSARLPRVNDAYDTEAQTGRGLALVERLASCWGVDRTADGSGKVVWFEVRP